MQFSISGFGAPIDVLSPHRPRRINVAYLWALKYSASARWFPPELAPPLHPSDWLGAWPSPWCESQDLVRLQPSLGKRRRPRRAPTARASAARWTTAAGASPAAQPRRPPTTPTPPLVDCRPLLVANAAWLAATHRAQRPRSATSASAHALPHPLPPPPLPLPPRSAHHLGSWRQPADPLQYTSGGSPSPLSSPSPTSFLSLLPSLPLRRLWRALCRRGHGVLHLRERGGGGQATATAARRGYRCPHNPPAGGLDRRRWRRRV